MKVKGPGTLGLESISQSFACEGLGFRVYILAPYIQGLGFTLQDCNQL
jgi:hypothetical protein